MTRFLTVLTIVGLSMLGLAAPASAATQTVQVANTAFTPPSPSGLAGDSVTWSKSSSGGFHNVSSTNDMFRSGAPTEAAFSYTRVFSAGTYAYRCEIHSDMTGRVRMRPRVTAAPTGLPFTVRWASSATNTGSVFRVMYRVNGGDWRVWRSATTDFFQVFGASNQPVKVVAGSTYQFRARSTRSGNDSGISPITSFTP